MIGGKDVIAKLKQARIRSSDQVVREIIDQVLEQSLGQALQAEDVP